MKIRRDIFDYIYFAVFGLFLILFVTGQVTAITGTQLVVIDNADPNSMFPTYFQGDLFIISKDSPQDISIGDVIVYESNNGNRVIHRVIDIEQADNEYYFRVKGDDPVTNPEPDRHNGGRFIPFSDILGKVVKRLPYLGHISLAIQQNPAVRIFVYMIAIIAVLAILFWPEEEDDDEPTHYDFSKENMKKQMDEVKSKLTTFFNAFTTSKYKLLAWSLLVMLISLMVLPFFLPVFLPMPLEVERGVQNVRFESPMLLSEGPDLPDALFYNVFITIYDDGNLFNYIDSYTMQVIYDGQVIDETIWNTLRPIKGEFTVGGSITIDTSIINTVPVNSTFTIQITLGVDEAFGRSQLEPFTQNFMYTGYN